jgi:hypothetical protein
VIREGEHSHAFTKRLCELGFAVRIVRIPCSRRTWGGERRPQRLEKFEALGFGGEGATAIRSWGIFDDETIDVATGELLGRHHEERDSGRMLRACYNVLRERAGHSRRSSPRARARCDLHAGSTRPRRSASCSRKSRRCAAAHVMDELDPTALGAARVLAVVRIRRRGFYAGGTLRASRRRGAGCAWSAREGAAAGPTDPVAARAAEQERAARRPFPRAPISAGSTASS